MLPMNITSSIVSKSTRIDPGKNEILCEYSIYLKRAAAAANARCLRVNGKKRKKKKEKKVKTFTITNIFA